MPSLRFPAAALLVAISAVFSAPLAAQDCGGMPKIQRYVTFADTPRLRRAVDANSGWYTWPSAEEPLMPTSELPQIAAPAAGESEPHPLAHSPTVSAALATIEELETEWAPERLITLTEIPAPPFGEGPRAEAFAAMLREAGGFPVEIDEVGNVIGRRSGRGGGSDVAMIAHIDTVFPIETAVTVKREGSRFTAPGIGDNTRGLVSLLLIAEAMKRHDVQTRGDLLFVGSVGEEGEGNLRGVRHLFAAPDHGIDNAVVIDGGDVSRLVTQAVGSNRYRITFAGPGGHSYGAFGTVNPHHATARAITDFVERARLVAESGEKATYSVAELEGGTGINVIPTSSTFAIDMRSADPGQLAALDAILRSAIERTMVAENEGREDETQRLTVAIESLGKRPAATNPPGTTLVQTALASLAALGVEAQEQASSTDANLPMSIGVPSITMSRGGRSGRSHALDEYWIAEDPHLGPQATLLTAVTEAGLAP